MWRNSAEDKFNKLGGSALYGLRRQLLDVQGRRNQVLAYGNRKSLRARDLCSWPRTRNRYSSAHLPRVRRRTPVGQRHRRPSERGGRSVPSRRNLERKYIAMVGAEKNALEVLSNPYRTLVQMPLQLLSKSP